MGLQLVQNTYTIAICPVPLVVTSLHLSNKYGMRLDHVVCCLFPLAIVWILCTLSSLHNKLSYAMGQCVVVKVKRKRLSQKERGRASPAQSALTWHSLAYSMVKIGPVSPCVVLCSVSCHMYLPIQLVLCPVWSLLFFCLLLLFLCPCLACFSCALCQFWSIFSSSLLNVHWWVLPCQV